MTTDFPNSKPSLSTDGLNIALVPTSILNTVNNILFTQTQLFNNIDLMDKQRITVMLLNKSIVSREQVAASEVLNNLLSTFKDLTADISTILINRLLTNNDKKNAIGMRSLESTLHYINLFESLSENSKAQSILLILNTIYEILTKKMSSSYINQEHYRLVLVNVSESLIALRNLVATSKDIMTHRFFDDKTNPFTETILLESDIPQENIKLKSMLKDICRFILIFENIFTFSEYNKSLLESCVAVVVPEQNNVTYH